MGQPFFPPRRIPFRFKSRKCPQNARLIKAQLFCRHFSRARGPQSILSPSRKKKIVSVPLEYSNVTALSSPFLWISSGWDNRALWIRSSLPRAGTSRTPDSEAGYPAEKSNSSWPLLSQNGSSPFESINPLKKSVIVPIRIKSEPESPRRGRDAVRLSPLVDDNIVTHKIPHRHYRCP